MMKKTLKIAQFLKTLKRRILVLNYDLEIKRNELEFYAD